jgi:peptidoglycan-associated lipoprotein
MNVRLRQVAIVLATLAAVTTLEGCRRKPPVQTTPTVGTASDDGAARARADSMARAQYLADSIARARADSIARANTGSVSAAEMAELRGALLAAVYFAFDQADLDSEARSNLDGKLAILLANPDLTIRVGGHTDERGSDEYNLALGQRRASTAKQYLVERGVAEGRLETISWGEERPTCGDATESCWGRNRRAEFEVLSGGATLRRP